MANTKPDAKFDDPAIADELGVGRNMAKSIWHWLQVTGLAHRPTKDGPITLTPVGSTIRQRDPYFQHQATWWALHVNLAIQAETAVTWLWFFNEFTRQRFNRADCTEELNRWLEQHSKRKPSLNTLARDVTCLLQSYAVQLPPEQGDPEDLNDSPFRKLGLLTHFRDSDRFERTFRPREIPPELLGFALTSRPFTYGEAEVGFADALASPCGLGRIFMLDSDGLLSLISQAEALPDAPITVRLLGGERMITYAPWQPSVWLERYYDRVSTSDDQR